MSGFCGDATCAARVTAWLCNPDDPPADPCRQCRLALEEFFNLRPAKYLPTLPMLARRLACVGGID